jgi:hypothetical protein
VQDAVDVDPRGIDDQRRVLPREQVGGEDGPPDVVEHRELGDQGDDDEGVVVTTEHPGGDDAGDPPDRGGDPLPAGAHGGVGPGGVPAREPEHLGEPWIRRGRGAGLALDHGVAAGRSQEPGGRAARRAGVDGAAPQHHERTVAAVEPTEDAGVLLTGAADPGEQTARPGTGVLVRPPPEPVDGGVHGVLPSRADRRPVRHGSTLRPERGPDISAATDPRYAIPVRRAGGGGMLPGWRTPGLPRARTGGPSSAGTSSSPASGTLSTGPAPARAASSW